MKAPPHSYRHGHAWIAAAFGLAAGLFFLIYAPALPAISASLFLFAGFHALGLALLGASVWTWAPRRVRAEAPARRIDFGASSKGPNALAMLSASCFGAATLTIVVAPGFWPLSLLLAAQSLVCLEGQFALRAASRPDVAVLPLVRLLANEDGHVLVVNVCAGRSLLELANAFPRARFTAADDFESSAVRARLESHLALAGLASGVSVERCPVTALPFGPAAFDAVVGAHIYDHIGDPASGLREAHRVLAPGGRLLITLWTPNWSLFTVASLASFFVFKPRREWRARLASLGFAIEREGSINAGWYVLARKIDVP